MSQHISTAAEWLQWATAYIDSLGGPPRYVQTFDGEIMHLVSQDEIESNPVQWLQYYASQMAWVSSELFYTKAAYEILEDTYKKLVNVFVASYKEKAGYDLRLCLARAYYSGLSDAITMARTKYLRNSTEFSTAETYRDIVSRAMTMVDKERKVTKQW